jgi:hypothetical protein
MRQSSLNAAATASEPHLRQPFYEWHRNVGQTLIHNEEISLSTQFVDNSVHQRPACVAHPRIKRELRRLGDFLTILSYVSEISHLRTTHARKAGLHIGLGGHSRAAGHAVHNVPRAKPRHRWRSG